MSAGEVSSPWGGVVGGETTSSSSGSVSWLGWGDEVLRHTSTTPSPVPCVGTEGWEVVMSLTTSSSSESVSSTGEEVSSPWGGVVGGETTCSSCGSVSWLGWGDKVLTHTSTTPSPVPRVGTEGWEVVTSLTGTSLTTCSSSESVSTTGEEVSSPCGGVVGGETTCSSCGSVSWLGWGDEVLTHTSTTPSPVPRVGIEGWEVVTSLTGTSLTDVGSR